MLNPIYGLCPNMVFGLGPVSLSHCVESHIWSLPIYGLWVRFPCPNCAKSNCLWVRFPCPTVLNPIYGLCPNMVFGLGPVSLSHCVESHIWSLPIYGLWVRFPCPNCAKSNCLWVRFPCPTVLNPIYGLCPNMVFGLGPVSLSHCVESHIWSLPIYGLWVRFPCPNCAKSNCLWVRFPCPTVLNPIYDLCPNMVFGLGPVSLSHCVESHIWSLPIYGLWVWFPCPNCVESYRLWVRFPCPTVLNPIYGLCPYIVFGSGFPYMVFGLVSLSQLC